MQYVFVSHADEDKPRIAPFLRLLKSAQLPLWIDRAQDLGPEFDDEGRIELGEAWPASLARALEGAACVVVFWSMNAVQSHRQELHREANFGLRQGKLLQVVLDADALTHLHPVFSEMQAETLFRLADEADIDRAVARVARAARGLIGRVAERTREATRAMPPCLLPYVIDRNPQLDRLCSDLVPRLKGTTGVAGIRPEPPRPAYLTLARHADCPDRFVERISRIDGPALCRRFQRTDWQDWDDELPLRWPTESSSRPDRVAERLDALLARYAGRIERPRCVVSFVGRVRRAEAGFVQAWLDGWARHFADLPGSPLIPLLFVDLDANSGWLARRRVRRLLRDIEAMGGARQAGAKSVAPVLLDAFTPLTAEDARAWARQNFAVSRTRAAADKFVQETFSSGSTLLPLSSFADRVTTSAWYQEMLRSSS